ncbi:response regulator [Pontitalea aquivivens]|uniref:response regulator n=1 Tax=Pontitalea aquivivens TaxID=3388663 RepID=UPI0039707EA1
MKILVADDHGLVRETICAFIETQEGASVVQASNLQEALDRIDDAGPFDLVLLDYKMPGMDGLAGLERVLAHSGGRPVALLSGNISRATVEQALTAGAAGFVPKTLASKSLLQALRFMIAGEKYVPFDFMRQPDAPADSQFTPREMRVLQGICEGKANKVIAADLGLQEVTIKLHVKSVCRKLGARNRTHAAMIARDLRLV